MDVIRIRGARTHNLREHRSRPAPRPADRRSPGCPAPASPRSPSTRIYAEGQRRYVESLSAYARQFLSVMEKPDVDHIEGLSPAISIEQKATSHNPRSTVGTITEIYDYLRVLYARAGTPRCPDHGQELEAQTVSQMVDQVLALPRGHAAAAARAGRARSARASTRRCSSNCARRASCVRASTARLRRARRGAGAERCASTRSRPWSTGFKRAAGCQAAPGRILRDGARARRGHGPRRILRRRRTREPLRVLQPLRLPGLRLQPRASSSRGCSPSTTRWAPAAPATGSACRSSSTRRAWSSHPELSLAGGAVRGWDRRNAYYFQLIQSLATSLPLRHRDAVERAARGRAATCCSGAAARRRSTFRYFDARGGTTASQAPLRRHPAEPRAALSRDRVGDRARRAGASIVGTRACAECHGSRLNRAARNVFVAGHNLPQIAALPIADARRVLRRPAS